MSLGTKESKMNFQSSLEFLKIRIAKFNVEISQELQELGEELDGYDDIFNNRDLYVPLLVDRFDDAKEDFVGHMYVLIDIIENLHRMMEKFDWVTLKLRGPGMTNTVLNELSVGLLKRTLNQIPSRPEVERTYVTQTKPPQKPEVEKKLKSEKKIKPPASRQNTGNNQMVAGLVAQITARNLNSSAGQSETTKSVPEIGISVNGLTPEYRNEPVKPTEVKVVEKTKIETPKPAPRKVKADSDKSTENQKAQELYRTNRPVSMIDNVQFFNGRKLVFDSEEKTPTTQRRNSHKYHQTFFDYMDPSDRWLNSLRKYKSTNNAFNTFKRLTSLQSEVDDDCNLLTEEEKDEISKHLDLDKHEWQFKQVVTAADMIEFIKKQKLVDNKL